MHATVNVQRSTENQFSSNDRQKVIYLYIGNCNPQSPHLTLLKTKSPSSFTSTQAKTYRKHFRLSTNASTNGDRSSVNPKPWRTNLQTVQSPDTDTPDIFWHVLLFSAAWSTDLEQTSPSAAKRGTAQVPSLQHNVFLRSILSQTTSSPNPRLVPEGRLSNNETVSLNWSWLQGFRKMFVSCCFEPSQPQRITSGLNTNLTPSPSYSFHMSSYHKSWFVFFSLFTFRGH